MPECPTIAAQARAWVNANPLKVQAALALILGNVPGGLVTLIRTLIA